MSSPHKPQRPINAFADADARSCLNSECRLFNPTANGELSAIETRSVLGACNIQRLRQFSWAVRQSFDTPVPPSPLAHSFNICKRLKSANQHASGLACRLGNNVQTLVDTVNEIHV